MIQVKIDRRTIKKNKDGGSTQTTVSVGFINEIEFETNNMEIALEILKPYFHLSTTGYPIGGVVNATGYLDIIDFDAIKKLRDTKGNRILKLQSSNNLQEIRHLPIPKYSYQYRLNTLIPCNECGNKIRLGDIGIYEREGYYADSCPICKSVNSFDYKLEQI